MVSFDRGTPLAHSLVLRGVVQQSVITGELSGLQGTEERSIGDWAKAVYRGVDRFFYAFNVQFWIFGSVLQLLRLKTVQLGSCAGDSTLLDAANSPKLVLAGSLRF